MQQSHQISWFPAEQAILSMPADLTVSDWAAAHREFPRDASFPGRWDPHKAPYAQAPMDAFTSPEVERITLMGAARSVKTEIWLNMLGYLICQDPGPVLVVGPTETKVKRICKRITKMLKASPELRQYLTGNQDDLQTKSIVLRHMEIIFATAGSASDLGEFEARYIFETETDKYPASAGGFGSPTQMAEMRARTFFNRKIVTDSTPTDPEGFIHQDYQRSDRRQYWVPCPACGGYQVLDFFRVKHRGEQRMAWPQDLQRPEYIKQARPAVYECRYCQAEIEERQKAGMLARGVWGAENPEPDGSRPEELPHASHEGYWWGAEISPFATWTEMAAKFFEVRPDREQLKTYYNEWLGLAWKEIVKSQQASAILKLRTRLPSLVVPENTLGLTAGIDSQKRGFWVVLRAWVLTLDGLRESHKIRHGFVESFGELERWLFEDVYRTETSDIEHRVWAGLIDTGGGLMGEGEATLTTQVYDWLRRSGRGRIFGSKGSSKPLGGRLTTKGAIEHYPSGKAIPGGLVLWRLDTNALKDFLWADIENGRFHLDADTDETYAAHLAAEVKERNKLGKLVWTVQHQRDNHLLDCEILAKGAAEAHNVWLLPRPQVRETQNVLAAATINPLTHKPRGSFLKRG
ncbi:MAG: terminase gpA endonuclease subunit [Desulfobaccales bacterium]